MKDGEITAVTSLLLNIVSKVTFYRKVKAFEGK